MSEPAVPEYRIEELTEEEQKALLEQEPSCQSEEISEGESDLSLRKEERGDGDV